MSAPRRETVDDRRQGIYHCIARCVRRAFLCGQDPLTGKDCDHRKAWIRDRLHLLAGTFAIDVCGYAVMSNHLHLVLRTRPHLAREWSAQEVARRWLALFPKRLPAGVPPAAVADHAAIQTAALAGNGRRLEELRARLGCLSWFMRCLNEHIARRANREDECTGRFWEGRFKCQALLDEAAVATCMTYVDLNPIRAKRALTPEASEYTSVQDRVLARQGAKKLAAAQESAGKATRAKGPTRRQRERLCQAQDDARRAAWLAPMADGEVPRREACLPLTTDEYIALIDGTGRALRSGQRGRIDPALAPILRRLEIDADAWLMAVKRYGSLFWRMVGKVESMIEATQRLGVKWLRGIRASGTVFAGQAPPG